MNKTQKIIFSVAGILCLIVLVFAILNSKDAISSGSANNNKYDDFAKCITERGAVMYGAEWCAHCKEQKNVFGDSFKFVKYVECPDNINFCLDNGIQGYPTWMIGTSTKIEGFDKNTTMKELSEITSCELPL